MNILFLGDIVGNSGCSAVKKFLPNIIKSKNYSSILLELPVHDLIIVLSNINPAKGRKSPIIENTLLSKIIKYFKTNKKLLHYYLTYFKNDFVSIHFLKQLFLKLMVLMFQMMVSRNF